MDFFSIAGVLFLVAILGHPILKVAEDDKYPRVKIAAFYLVGVMIGGLIGFGAFSSYTLLRSDNGNISTEYCTEHWESEDRFDQPQGGCVSSSQKAVPLESYLTNQSNFTIPVLVGALGGGWGLPIMVLASHKGRKKKLSAD